MRAAASVERFLAKMLWLLLVSIIVGRRFWLGGLPTWSWFWCKQLE